MLKFLTKKIYLSRITILLTVLMLLLSLAINFREYIFSYFEYTELHSYDASIEEEVKSAEELKNQLKDANIPFIVKTFNRMEMDTDGEISKEIPITVISVKLRDIKKARITII